MFNSNDIYSHLVNGGSIEDLQKALKIEIQNAQDRIIKEKAAELKKQEAKEKAAKARTAAFNALKTYLALVNPSVTEEFLNIVFDTLETIEWVLGKEDWTHFI